MDQGWKRLPLLIVILLLWRNADGFKGGAYSDAHHQWGQPSDSFSPRAVQSSMSEAHVPGILPVEGVGSSVFPNKPLRSRPKLNLLQFVKGGSSSSQSMSHAQTAPSSSISTLPLSVRPSSSLTSSGSTVPGAASGLSWGTQFVASGSGPLVSTQGEHSSYPAQLGVSGQSTSDGLHVSSSQETSVHQSAGASLSQESISHSSSSVPGATSTSQGSPVPLSESWGQPVSSLGQGSYSGLSQGASNQYNPDSNTELGSSQSTGNQSSPSPFSSSSDGSSGVLASGSSFTGLSPLVQSGSDSNSTETATPLLTQGSVPYNSLSSQAQGSTTSQGSSGAELPPSSVHSIPTQIGSDRYNGVSQSLSASSVSTSTQSRPGTQLATSSHYVPVQGGSSSASLLLKPQAAVGEYAPSSHTKYVASMSTPQATYSQSASSGSSYRAVSQVGSLSQTGVPSQFTPQGGNSYSGLLPVSQATSSQYALGYSKPVSSPQSTSSQSASVLSSHKQYTSASQGNSGAQFGASTGLALQGMSSSYSGSVQSQGITSQFAPGSPSPYDGLYCKCALSPQGIDGQSILSSRKQFTSSYGTQSGSFTPFTLHGSITYDGSPQPQGTASLFAPVSHSYPSVSPSQGVASQSTTVRVPQPQFASTYTGSSGTQAGSSTLFTQQGSTASGGLPLPQDATSQFVPGPQSSYAGVSLSSPQAGLSTTVQSSRKQFTSTYTGSSGTQAGSSTRFTQQGSTASGGSSWPQVSSQFVSGSSSPYASVSLSSPQGVGQSSQAYQGYSASQSQKSQRWQPSAARWSQVIQTSGAAVSQDGSSSQSSPMQFSSLSSAGGSSSRASHRFISAQGGSTSHSGSFQSKRLSAKYTPGSQFLSYGPSVAGQGTSSASLEVLSSYGSMNNQNAPAQPSRSSSSSRFFSVKRVNSAT